jgi:hypothetical protein
MLLRRQWQQTFSAIAGAASVICRQSGSLLRRR